MMKKTNLVVGNQVAKPGEKKTAFETVPFQGFSYTFPLFLINGVGEGPTLVVTAGVHAAEYASIAAALQLGQHLAPETLRGQVIVAPVINTPGFGVRSIYVNPQDGKNLNRVFPGKFDGSASEQVADWLFHNVIRKADYYVDLHGGDLVEALIPFTIFYVTGNEKVDAASIKMAQLFGIKNLVKSDTRGSVYSAAATAGIPAILTEAGGQGIWHAKDVRLHVDGLDRLMRHFGMLPGSQPRPTRTRMLNQFIWMRSEHEGYWYPQVSVGKTVEKGQYLGGIQDAWGNVLQSAQAPASGEVLFLVSSLAINKGDPLLAIGAE